MTVDELADHRQERLVQELMRQFKAKGGIKVGVDHVADVELFRKAARTAARRVGITIHTGVSHEKSGEFVFAFET
jgi:D-serine deaminase-like pyridoxal phosphate-dependent protein